MAIKSIKELPKNKRASGKQIESAKKAKPIDKKGKSVGRKYGRLEYGFGKVSKKDVPGIIKGFRRKFKANFGTILKDTDGNIIARTHIARGDSTVPEQLAVKALSKYGKKYEEVQLVLVIFDKKSKKPLPKKAVKKSVKKAVKKPAKKAAKKPAKKTVKKPAKKAAKKPTKKTTKKTVKKVAKKGKKK